VACDYPETQSFLLSWEEITDPILKESLKTDPRKSIRAGEYAIYRILKDESFDAILSLRITSMAPEDRLQLRDIRTEHLGKMVYLPEILVTRRTIIRPRLLSGVFRCRSCGFEQEVEQDGFLFQEPLECPKDQEGCGKRAGSTRFDFVPDKSIFVDQQKIEIQDPPDVLGGRAQPERREAYIEGDITGNLEAGDRIKIVGILREKARKAGSSKSTTFDTFIDVIYYEQEDRLSGVPTIKDEKVAKMKPLELLVDAIAPSLYGYRDIKTALALQFFGGVSGHKEDGSRNRGDIHILLVGDPSVGKSDLLSAMASLWGIAVQASGKGRPRARGRARPDSRGPSPRTNGARAGGWSRPGQWSWRTAVFWPATSSIR